MRYIILLLALFSLQACSNSNQGSEANFGSTQNNTKPLIVVSTNIVADAIRTVADTLFEVKALMGPGVDPHLYKPTQKDLKTLAQADIIVFSGLHLEGKMADVFTKLTRTKTVISLGDSLPHDSLIVVDEATGVHDPHFWFHPELWATSIDNTAKTLSKFYPAQGEQLMKNTTAFTSKLRAEYKVWQAELNEIPSAKKVLITNHDAFHYFANFFNFKVHSLQGISTVSEYGLKDVSETVELIVNEQIPAVFVENIASDKAAKALISGCAARGFTTKIGGHLFSDSLGELAAEEGTYIGMMSYNISTIKNGLMP